jgi:hypothetical protein
MCILAPSALGLQLLLNECELYGLSHDIMYNPQKSLCLFISPSSYKVTVPQGFLMGDPLQYTEKAIYLGVMITNDLGDNSDIQRQLRCLYASTNTIISKFKQCSLPIKCLLLETYSLNFLLLVSLVCLYVYVFMCLYHNHYV